MVRVVRAPSAARDGRVGVSATLTPCNRVNGRVQCEYSGTGSAVGSGEVYMSEDAQIAAETYESTESKACPFCKEVIRIGATKCPYCQAAINKPPDHGGECPFCKEQINVEAVRCRHCKSDLGGFLPVNVSVRPATTDPRVTSAGCSGCGQAAPVGMRRLPGSVGMRLLPGPSDPIGDGLRRYCFWFCDDACPAGPECCVQICVDLPDRGPAIGFIG